MSVVGSTNVWIW